MSKPPVSISLSSFGADLAKQQGQASLLPQVKASGALLAEIREELFVEVEPDLATLAQLIRANGLQGVYSSPLQLWQADGTLDVAGLRRALQRAQILKARWLKVSLGHYQTQSLDELAGYLVGLSVRLLIENDQTPQGGKLAPLQAFFAAVQRQQLPIGMTFDIGNWQWQQELPDLAAVQLGRHVEYVHCKAVYRKDERLHACPPNETELATWNGLFENFARDVPRAIEFPLQGHDLDQQIAIHVANLANLGQAQEDHCHA